MENQEFIKVLTDNNMVIPLYLFKNYKKLNLELEEFIVLMYLYSEKVDIFAPNKIGNDLSMSLDEVMEIISNLTDKKMVEITSKKNKNKVMEDYISLNPFFSKLGLLIFDNSDKDSSELSVYELIEKEFGRTLSPMEYEIIKAWLDGNTKEELIKEAVKEAVFNGVTNLRYIDKILYEWKKAGIKSLKDVEERRKKFKGKKEDKTNVELFDYDWFDDDEK